MPAPEMDIKEEKEESKQLDSTRFEHSTALPIKKEGREDLEVRRPLTGAPISPVKLL